MQIESNIPFPTHPALVVSENEPMPETHTVKQVMSLLNCGHTTVYRLANEGEITLIKVFGKSLVLGLRDFIERKAAEARQLRTA
jgi:excisionase family DNA binding protein